MSDVITNFFGRSKNDADESATREVALQVATDTADHDETAIVVEAIDDTETEAADDAETEPGEAVDQAGTTEDGSTEDEAAEADTAEVADEATTEATTAEGATAEDADEDTAPAEHTASTEDTAPVAQAQPEEAPEPAVAETRPAAGTRGTTTVGDGVVAKVVTMVARKAGGVHDLDGVVVEVADGIASIRISLVIEFGHAVKALAEQIRVDVIDAVEQYLGLDVATVDVDVTDIHLPDAA